MNKKMTVLGGLLMAVVMTAYSVSGTYAKYTSTFTGSDSARVAKWAFKIGDIADTSAENAGTTFTFDLFKTINDSDGENAETDIAAPTADDTTKKISGLIAPGTSGSFDIKLQNLSEVTAMYGIKYEVTNSDSIPVEFCTVTETVDCTNDTDWKATIDEVVADKTNTKLAMNAGSDTTTTVKWRWVYEKGTGDTLTANDATDTALGIDGTAVLKVDATVVVTQVD